MRPGRAILGITGPGGARRPSSQEVATRLLTLRSCGRLAQGPLAQIAMAPVQTATAQVRGAVERSEAAALASARTAAEAQIKSVMTDRAVRIVEARRSFWMPDFLTRDFVRRSLDGFDAWRCFQVVDRSDDVREHEFGRSFRTTLWIAEDPRRTASAEQQLRASLRRGERVMLGKLGATAVFWGVLAFACFWLDRLSRGYMTARLWLVGLLLGGAVPTALFLV